MEFGALVLPKPETVAGDVRALEQQGFTHAWVPDSHMIYGDVYACMALAAGATTKIKLGTGVAIGSNRISPVIAHSIATINAMAPGRVILGFGTGHTGRRVMGLPPVKFKDFRTQVRNLRELLGKGETFYEAEGLRRKVRFLHLDRRFIRLEPRIPLYVAASARQAMQLAGEFGDGVITTGVITEDAITHLKGELEAGATRSGRTLPRNFPIVGLTHVCVLRPGETLESSRVVDATGHWVMAVLHAYAEGFGNPENLPAAIRAVYASYADHVSKMKTPSDERYLEIHDGHCAYLKPEERQFVTPELISSVAIVGKHEEVASRIAALERAGLSQVFINAPMDGFRDYVKDIGEALISH